MVCFHDISQDRQALFCRCRRSDIEKENAAKLQKMWEEKHRKNDSPNNGSTPPLISANVPETTSLPPARLVSPPLHTGSPLPPPVAPPPPEKPLEASITLATCLDKPNDVGKTSDTPSSPPPSTPPPTSPPPSDEMIFDPVEETKDEVCLPTSRDQVYFTLHRAMRTDATFRHVRTCSACCGGTRSLSPCSARPTSSASSVSGLCNSSGISRMASTTRGAGSRRFVLGLALFHVHSLTCPLSYRTLSNQAVFCWGQVITTSPTC